MMLKKEKYIFFVLLKNCVETFNRSEWRRSNLVERTWWIHVWKWRLELIVNEMYVRKNELLSSKSGEIRVFQNVFYRILLTNHIFIYGMLPHENLMGFHERPRAKKKKKKFTWTQLCFLIKDSGNGLKS